MNEYAQPIKGQKVIFMKSGYIAYEYKSIFFKVAKLTYELFENEEFQYTFEPFYDVIDAFDEFDIPGINLSLRYPQYFRANVTPVFITERVIPRNRVNLQEELKKIRFDYYNSFEMLLDAKTVYSGDSLSLKSGSNLNVKEVNMESQDIYKTIIFILKKLANRDNFNIGTIIINEINRTSLIKNYLYLYQKTQKYYENKVKKNRGRKKNKVSFVVLKEIRNLYTHGIITIDEAVIRSGLKSKRTFYRRLKELETECAPSTNNEEITD